MGARGGAPGGLPGPECAGCQKPIRERYLLKALDQLWHEDCLKCACCDCRLGEVGSTLFTKANLILCKRDYLRLFGTTGLCSACNKTIPAFEMVMRARGNVYHLDCFACQQCNHRFCVGDKFYLFDNRILCEYDHEERLLFHSSHSCGGSGGGPNINSRSSNGGNGHPGAPNNTVTSSSPASSSSCGPPPPGGHRSPSASQMHGGRHSQMGQQQQHPSQQQQQQQHSHHHHSSSVLPPGGMPPYHNSANGSGSSSAGSSGGPPHGYVNSLEQLKRATENLTPVHPGIAGGVHGPGVGGPGPVHDDASSGYGSPDSFLSDGK